MSDETRYRHPYREPPRGSQERKERVDFHLARLVPEEPKTSPQDAEEAKKRMLAHNEFFGIGAVSDELRRILGYEVGDPEGRDD